MSSKRIKLIRAVRSFNETIMIEHVADWDYCKMSAYEKVIALLDARLPKPVPLESKISSQRKLFP
jgi:hypothetical protein